MFISCFCGNLRSVGVINFSALDVVRRSKAVTEISRRRSLAYKSTSTTEKNILVKDSKDGGPYELVDSKDHASILQALEKLPIFAALKSEIKENIVRGVYVHKVKASDVVIIESDSGKTSSEMYIVKEGTFDVYQTQSGSRVLVNKKGKGDFFGEVALLYNCPRTATIVAKVDSVLWVLDRKTFKSHIRKHHLLMHQSQFSSKLITFLNQCYIFQKLEGNEREALFKHFDEEQFSAEDEVIAEGATPEHLYIIREGAAVVLERIDDELVVCDRLFPGDFFGYNCSTTLRDMHQQPQVLAGSTGSLVVIRLPAEILRKLPEHVHERMKRRSDAFSTKERFKRLSLTRTRIKLTISNHSKLMGASEKSASTMYGTLEEVTLIDNDYRGTPKCDNAFDSTFEIRGEVKDLLGSGAYSNVKLIYCKEQDRYFAMKCIKKLDAARIKEHVYCEKTITSLLLHPLFVRLYGCFQNDVELAMLFDYVEAGDLMDLLEANLTVVEEAVKTADGKKTKRCFQGFDEDIVRFYTASLSLALKHLHGLGIVYRDMKPENVLIDSNGFIKLGDFGFAKQISDCTFTFCGTPGYLAPECILSSGYDCRMDWWSLGVLTYVITTGSQPFAIHNQDEPSVIIQRIVDRDFDIFYPQYINKGLYNFILACLQHDPSSRIGDENIQSHSFFSRIDFDDILTKRISGPDISKMLLTKEKRIRQLRRMARQNGRNATEEKLDEHEILTLNEMFDQF